MKKYLTNKIGYIYKITNPNNKIYIGQTINFIKRKSQYKNLYCKGQTAIYNSIKKYGWDKHVFEIVEECLCGENKVIISDKEIYWIEFYDSFHNGLNCDKGGLGRSSFVMSDEQKELLRQINLGKKHSKETKEKMGKSQVKRFTLKNERDKISLSHKGKKYSEESKLYMSKIHFGKKGTNLGKKFSDETKRKMSKPKSEEHKKKMSEAAKLRWKKSK